MTYENRQYLIFNTTELPLVDFNLVLETSEQTVRCSLDGTKTFVKWQDGGSIPEFVNLLTTKQGPYTHEQMLELLAGPEWNQPREI